MNRIAPADRAVATAPAWVATLRDTGLHLSGGGAAAWPVSAGAEKTSSLVARDAVCTVLFDGVLHNRAELIHHLDGLDDSSRAATTSDGELFLRAYRFWGEEALIRLKGTFAALVWDGARRSGLCLRDPIGVYPLFYSEAGRDLVLSTSVDALLRDSRVSGAVNRPVLAEYLAGRWPRMEETFFASVRRLPPGHVLQVRAGRRTVRRYWDPAPEGTPLRWSGADAVERFGELLTQAVERCLAGGRAGIYLSGGLDSVSIATVATGLARPPGAESPLGLSLVFPHPDCNEEAVQKSVASELGLEHLLLGFDEAVAPRGFLRQALAITRDRPAPLLNVWSPAYFRLAIEGKRRGCRVVLWGSGGDEWLTTAPELAADMLGALDLAGLARLGRTARASWPVSHFRIARSVWWSSGARPLLRHAAGRVLHAVAPSVLRAHRRRGYGLPTWLVPDPALQREMRWRIEELVDESLREPPPRSHYERAMHRVLDHPVYAIEREENFENGRRLGLRVLAPYWDADLIDLLYRTPPELLNQGGRTKGLVRAALAQRFPHLGFDRQQKVVSLGFFRSAMLAEAPRAWAAMGGPRALVQAGVVGDGCARMVGDALANRQAGLVQRVWDVLNVESWLRPRTGVPTGGWEETYDYHG